MAIAYRDAGYDWCSVSDHGAVTADPGVEGILWIQGIEETKNFIVPGQPTTKTCADVVRSNVTNPSGAPDIQGAIDAGPYAHLAHPWVPTNGYTLDEALQLTGYAGIAVNPTSAVLEPYLWDDILTSGRQCWGVFDEDAHRAADAGCWRVIVFADSLTVENVIAALLAGEFYCTRSPTLTITHTSSSLTVATPDAADVYFIGKGSAKLQVNENVTEATYDYKAGDGYVRVAVKRRSDDAWAITNATIIDI